MANAIETIKKATTLLDEVYKNGSKTSILDGDITLTQAGANAGEILIPKIDMDGLADYSRADGYASGDVTFEFETKKFNYDRGRKFSVDAMDNEETLGLAFGKLASEFVRTKVVPEVDAFRIANYVTKANTKKEETLTTGKEVVTALRACANAMDEAEVTAENRVLFITPTLLGMVEDLDTTASKKVLEKFSTIISVPASRMYSEITLGDNGFTKASTGKAVNFVAVAKDAVLQYQKHGVNKTVSPELNQTSDGWLFFYRAYQLSEVKDNKVTGIYASTAATV